MCNLKKSLVTFFICLICFQSFCFPAYADVVSTTTSLPITTTTTTTTTSNSLIIGKSSIDIVVSNDNLFTGLDTLISSYVPQSIDNNTKTLLTKSLISLVVSVVTGDSVYTLETFKDAFVQICLQYGIEVTEDFLDAITKYATHYLDSEFEQGQTDIYLSSIYSTLGFISIVLVLIWIGGARL